MINIYADFRESQTVSTLIVNNVSDEETTINTEYEDTSRQFETVQLHLETFFFFFCTLPNWHPLVPLGVFSINNTLQFV